MARGINKVILIGNLGGDPEVKYIPSGAAVVSVTLATNESWKDRNGERQERTEWHRLVFWDKLAEIVGQYLKKGSKIYAEGRLQTRSWDDQSGQKRYTTEVVVNEMQMLDARGDGGGQFSGGGGGADPGPASMGPPPGNGGGQMDGGQSGGGAAPMGAGPEDDDLPF